MTEFYKLPDNIESDILKEKFGEFLVYYSNNTTKENIDYALNELSELADRQQHTYKALDDELRADIEKYILSIIDLENEDIMDTVLCIVPRIGLDSLYKYIYNKKATIVNKKVVEIIIESEIEYGENVGNPYSGM